MSGAFARLVLGLPACWLVVACIGPIGRAPRAPVQAAPAPGAAQGAEAAAETEALATRTVAERLRVAQDLLRRRAYAEAERCFLTLVSDAPHEAEAQLGLAQLLLLRGVAERDAAALAGARAALATVQRLCPADTPAHRQAARLAGLTPP